MNNLEEQVKRIKYYEERFGSPPGHQCYGFGELLKKKLSLPVFIRLNIAMEHGVTVLDDPYPELVEAHLPVFVARKAQQRRLWEEHGKKSYVMGNPFVEYIRNKKVGSAQASGTLAFPGHSTHLISIEDGWDRYARQLSELPAMFQPVSVCLYWKDLLNGVGQYFGKYNIPVHTCGHMADPEFPANFYRLLGTVKYCTSNQVTSSIFYSVHAGVPYFIYGESPIYHNMGDSSRPMGDYSGDLFPRIRQLFTFEDLKQVSITEEMRDLVLDRLGLKEKIQPWTLRKVILEQYLKLLFYAARSRSGLLLKNFKAKVA